MPNPCDSPNKPKEEEYIEEERICPPYVLECGEDPLLIGIDDKCSEGELITNFQHVVEEMAKVRGIRVSPTSYKEKVSFNISLSTSVDMPLPPSATLSEKYNIVQSIMFNLQEGIKREIYKYNLCGNCVCAICDWRYDSTDNPCEPCSTCNNWPEPGCN